MNGDGYDMGEESHLANIRKFQLSLEFNITHPGIIGCFRQPSKKGPLCYFYLFHSVNKRLSLLGPTSGKGRGAAGSSGEGVESSGVSVGVVCSPRGCGGVGFRGDGVRMPSEDGVAGVRLRETKRERNVKCVCMSDQR